MSPAIASVPVWTNASVSAASSKATLARHEAQRPFVVWHRCLLAVTLTWLALFGLVCFACAQASAAQETGGVIELTPPIKSSRKQATDGTSLDRPLVTRRVRIGDADTSLDSDEKKSPRLLGDALAGDEAPQRIDAGDTAPVEVAKILPRSEDAWSYSEADRLPLSPELIELSREIQQTLGWYHQQHERVERRSPWGIMHAMIAFEADSVVRVKGQPVNALGWLCWNGPCAGNQLMMVRRGGLMARSGPGLQGHEGQFLAMLAQCGVRADNELRVGDQSFTVEDLVRYEQWNCHAGTELTFKLIGLSYYLDTDEEWQASTGETWTLERLIQEELKQQVVGAACGGTHRMMGYSFALRQREREGRPLEGQWARARTFVDDFIDYAFQLQNPDGSFSTEWFEGRAAREDVERRLQTTGHILEWLVFSIPESDLDDPRIIRAVVYLNALMWQGRQHDWEVGPRGHALHALRLYHLRRFGTSGLDQDASQASEIGDTRTIRRR